VGTRLYSMANSFNHSKLKKRITMMLKEKSNPWARLKYLYVLPLAAIAVTAFARPEISEKMEEISAVKVNDLAEIVQEKVLQDTVKVSKDDAVVVSGVKSKAEEEIVVFEVVEQMPEYPGGMNALQKYLMDKITSSPMKGKAGGRVMVGFTVAETGKIKDVHVLQSDEEALNREAERIVSEMPDWIPGKQRGRPVPVKYTIPVRFGSFRFAENKPPLILADGKEISMEAMEKLDPSTIESLSVLKDSASIKVYGKRGANGVILVNTQRGSKDKKHNIEISFSKKATNADAIPDFPVSGTVVDEEGRPKAGVSIIVPNTNHGTITDINGHFSLKAIKDGNLWFSFIGYKPVKAPVTSTMNIRMEQEVVKLFPELSGSALNVSSGTKGVNGVSIYGIKGEQPLVIIDGKEAMDKDALSKLAPDHIKSISVLKDKSAQAVYGDKGKNGVIIVEMLTDEEYQTRQNKK
ncbi:TonB family protein, partial [Bacteroides sp.]